MSVTDADVAAFLSNDYARIVRVVEVASGSRALAEDAVQEALARAWERGRANKPVTSLTGLVRSSAINLARSKLRRMGAERRATHRLVISAIDHPDSEPAIADPAVSDALAALPRRQREVVALHYLADLPVASVAVELGISEGTVKTQLHRARATLAKALGADQEVTA